MLYERGLSNYMVVNIIGPYFEILAEDFFYKTLLWDMT